jgi:hypothetical protein
MLELTVVTRASERESNRISMRGMRGKDSGEGQKWTERVCTWKFVELQSFVLSNRSKLIECLHPQFFLLIFIDFRLTIHRSPTGIPPRSLPFSSKSNHIVQSMQSIARVVAFSIDFPLSAPQFSLRFSRSLLHNQQKISSIKYIITTPK